MKTPLQLLLPLALTGAGVLAAAEPPAIRTEFIDPASLDVAAIRQAGEAATGKVATRLVTELTLALGAGGPENAVDFCHLNAQDLTAESARGAANVVAVKRTSNRLRNPANAPDAAERLALERVEKIVAAGDPPPPVLVQRVRRDDTAAPEWRVYRSIVMQPACLACHGSPDMQPPALRAALQERYPDDAALGYRAGDWRGFILAIVQPPDAPATAR